MAAKAKNDTFSPSEFNGEDPRITGGQFADSDAVSPKVTNSPDNNIGDGNKSGRHFQDSDDVYSLEGFNIIDSADDSYAGKSSSTTWSRTSVDVSRADRGSES